MPEYDSEVVRTPESERPYTAILRIDGKVIVNTLVDTREAGEALLADTIRKLREFEIPKDG
ncbi:MAG: hypothetical protein O6829_05125 [Alphaproteobacteria bacterium]|nr:hypothetical protein [Alphaproteobacteria bacterium]